MSLPVSQFFEAFGEASRRLGYSEIEQRIADDHKLELVAFRLMLHVREEGHRTGDLVSRVVAHASHASQGLDVLEQRRWITRRPTPQDRRIVIVRPTPTGLRVAHAFRARLRDDLALGVADWSEDELTEAAALLRRLAKAL